MDQSHGKNSPRSSSRLTDIPLQDAASSLYAEGGQAVLHADARPSASSQSLPRPSISSHSYVESRPSNTYSSPRPSGSSYSNTGDLLDSYYMGELGEKEGDPFIEEEQPGASREFIAPPGREGTYLSGNEGAYPPRGERPPLLRNDAFLYSSSSDKESNPSIVPPRRGFAQSSQPPLNPSQRAYSPLRKASPPPLSRPSALSLQPRSPSVSTSPKQVSHALPPLSPRLPAQAPKPTVHPTSQINEKRRHEFLKLLQVALTRLQNRSQPPSVFDLPLLPRPTLTTHQRGNSLFSTLGIGGGARGGGVAVMSTVNAVRGAVRLAGGDWRSGSESERSHSRLGIGAHSGTESRFGGSSITERGYGSGLDRQDVTSSSEWGKRTDRRMGSAVGRRIGSESGYGSDSDDENSLREGTFDGEETYLLLVSVRDTLLNGVNLFEQSAQCVSSLFHVHLLTGIQG